jgi:hypothetical protein
MEINVTIKIRVSFPIEVSIKLEIIKYIFLKKNTSIF